MDNRQAEFSKISHVYTEYKMDNRQAEFSKISPAYTEYKMDNRQAEFSKRVTCIHRVYGRLLKKI
jgi:hypothetical protein